MMNQALRRTFCCYCPKERPADEVFGNPRSQGIADNLAVEEIFVGSAIEPAFIGRDIGDIADPYLVGCRSLKLLVKKVIGNRECMGRIRRGLELPDLFTAYTKLLSDPSDPTDAYLDAVFSKITLQPFRPARLAGPFVSGLYLNFEASFLLSMS
jgi:hypothetical protein